MNEEEKKNMEDKVDSMTTTSFSVAGCPIKVFRRFLKFCENNAKMTKIFYRDGKKEVKEDICYSIGIQQLLDIADTDAKNQMLYERLIALEDKVAQLDGKSEEEPKKRIIKTMGRRGE